MMSSRPASRTAPSRSVSSELSPDQQQKAALVTAACHDHDFDALVHLATTRLGLVSDPLRRTACMLPPFPSIPSLFNPF